MCSSGCVCCFRPTTPGEAERRVLAGAAFRCKAARKEVASAFVLVFKGEAGAEFDRQARISTPIRGKQDLTKQRFINKTS